MDLSLSPSEVFGMASLVALPYALLILLMAAPVSYQHRQLQARNTEGKVNSQQQMIMKFLPSSC